MRLKQPDWDRETGAAEVGLLKGLIRFHEAAVVTSASGASKNRAWKDVRSWSPINRDLSTAKTWQRCAGTEITLPRTTHISALRCSTSLLLPN